MAEQKDTLQPHTLYSSVLHLSSFFAYCLSLSLPPLRAKEKIDHFYLKIFFFHYYHNN